MKTYDITEHLSSLKMFSDFKRSGLSTFEMFVDAVERGKLSFLSEDFILSKRKEKLKKFEDKPVIEDYDEQYPIVDIPDDILLNRKPEIDQFEQYSDAIYRKVEEYLDFNPHVPDHFDLDELEDIVLDSWFNNDFIKADKETINSYSKLRATFSPDGFSRCMQQYDAHIKNDLRPLEIQVHKSNSRNYQESEKNNVLADKIIEDSPQKKEYNADDPEQCHLDIFKSCEAFRFFNLLMKERDRKKNLTEISFIYRKFKYHRYLASKVGNNNFIEWINETYEISLPKLKTYGDTSPYLREKNFDDLKKIYMK